MNAKEIVYVLHKRGENSHYTGLDFLLEKNHGKVYYREFSIVDQFFKSFFKGRFARAWKQVINAFFLISLLFSKNKKIVLGIAPYDHKILFVWFFLKNHRVFYHTSWTVWDGTNQPRSKKMTPKVMGRWRLFLEQDAEHIFAVSEKSRQQLLKNYDIAAEKISVVYHSFKSTVFTDEGRCNEANVPNKFVYAGRFMREKGLEGLLEYFAVNPHKTFTLIGKGDLQDKVVEYAGKYPNIHYKGYISDPKKIAEEYRRHHYVLLNSFKTPRWEEAFGLVLIEAMSCGCVPVATKHTGPAEIISDQENGYLIEEGRMEETLVVLCPKRYRTLQQRAIKKALQFTSKVIAQRWRPVLG